MACLIIKIPTVASASTWRAWLVAALLSGLTGLACRQAEPVEDTKPAQSTNTPTNTGVLAAELDPGALAGHNLLFITLDTVRYDHLGCYGMKDAKTPTIDALAGRGVRFAHAISASSSTLPSHTTMMTGLEVPTHGARTNAKYIVRDDVTTLAEILRDRGYDTAAFVATAVLGRRAGLAQGFDHYDDKTHSPAPRRHYISSADHMTDLAISWLTDHTAVSPDRPFFMWVHYFDAHRRYHPREPYASQFPDRPYDAEIAFIDAELGRLLAFFDEQNLTNQTLMVLTADHGEGLGEHGEETHSRLIYDTTMHVPLVISCKPYFDRARVIDDVLVGLIDLTPTIVSMLGVDTDVTFEGIDLVTTTIDADRAIYLEALAPLVYHGWAPLHGLRRLDAKYIEAPTPEYFDLHADPNELNNLLEEDATAGATLADDLRRRREKWPSDDKATANTKPLSTVAVRRLASLGYVATGGPEDAPASHRFDPKDVVPLFETLNSEKPPVIRERARAIVMTPAKSLVVYRRGLILAQVARQQMPADLDALALVGMAQYRLGRFDRALIELAKARDGRASAGSEPDPATAMFVAMALHRLGRTDAARRELERAKTLVPTDPGVDDLPYRDLLVEVGELLASP